MIVDFSALDTSEQLDVKQVCSLLRQYQMQPIAARGIHNQDALPVLAENTQKSSQPNVKINHNGFFAR